MRAGACCLLRRPPSPSCLLPSCSPPLQIDERGNVWSSGPAGVEVWSPSGQHLGTIRVGPSANLAFAGRRLLVLAESAVWALDTKVAGNPLPMTGA